MVLLGVNIDHVATVRQARATDEPDPVWAAVEAQLAGADVITFHLREDRRHINDDDAQRLKGTVVCPLNMEMSIAPDVVDIACNLAPQQATLVPERREELTTEGGLDVVRHRAGIESAVSRLRGSVGLVHAFIEPIADQVRCSADCGFTGVELWTGGYAHAASRAEQQAALDELRRGIDLGRELGLEVHGGHGLTYRNISRVAAVPGFSGFHIGHSIVSRAVLVGMREAVRQMKELLLRHSPGKLTR
jgi:pyridoxine 5-phosphate synthase